MAVRPIETPAEPPHDPLAEANHRIANNLAALAVTFMKRLPQIEAGPKLVPRELVADLMKDIAGRIEALGRLHRLLSAPPMQGEVELDDVLAEVIGSFQTTGLFGDRLHVASDVKGCHVAAEQAAMLMLVFVEIATNAFKYAHPTGLPVELTVAAAATPVGGLLVHIADDGVGFPEGFDEVRDAGPGLRLVRSLVVGAGGSLAIRSDPLGLRFSIQLPNAQLQACSQFGAPLDDFLPPAKA
jgi:two-component sensor histidine kinase